MAADSSIEPRRSTWLSLGLETLVADYPWIADRTLRSEVVPDFDVVIVGSGYGGAVAAAGLSGCTDETGEPLRICLLERGREYLAGAFPSRQADLAGHVRFATPGATRQRGVHDGLYDVRWSDDAVAVVASGLGGGSLINAGVMEMPRPEVFREARWPHAIREDRDLNGLAEELRSLLGASPLPGDLAENLTKTSRLMELARSSKARLTPVTVAARSGPNKAGVVLNKCLLCGDCATGCNNNAKDSLDLNLLRLAQQAGTRIVTGATVLRVAPSDHDAKGWLLYVNHTDNHLRDRQPEPFRLRAKRVILAAGTFGSTEILLRSKGKLQFSRQLGRKFSANGDMLVIAHDLNAPVNAIADETQDPASPAPNQPGARGIGPTITAMIDLREGNKDTDLVIQDLAVPGPLRRLLEESATTFAVLDQLIDGDRTPHDGDRGRADDAAVDPRAMNNSLVLAMIGRDDAEGKLSLGDRPINDNADGLLTVCWPKLRLDARFDEHHQRLRSMLQESGAGGRVVNNMLWRPLPDDLERMFGPQRGPLLTVHPLGGCPMGEDVSGGVTDDCGRVFNPAVVSERAVHEGLVVLDGSIVPTSLGINPALTIAVLAWRALRKLEKEWNIKGSGRLAPAIDRSSCTQRPVLAKPLTIADPKPTLIELSEQIRGEVHLETSDGRLKPHEVEITLTTKSMAVADLIARETPTKGRKLTILPSASGGAGKGKLRILRAGKSFDAVSDQAKADDVALEAEIWGSLNLFALEPSPPWWRTARAFYAWVLNRGLRDSVQSLRLSPRTAGSAFLRRLREGFHRLQEWLHLRPPPDRSKPKSFLRRILDVCSRAGAVRLIEYDLHIRNVSLYDNTAFDARMFEGQSIQGIKRLTYARCASPFTQLLQMSLKQFPRMGRTSRYLILERYPILELNKRYLARQAIPLLRVVGQQDGVAALIDLLSLALYTLRVVLQVHAFSFRRPDAPSAGPHERLPGPLPGLPEPEIHRVIVDEAVSPPISILLTRYDGRARSITTDRPVLLIHGYSASGTTFAHAAVPGNLAQTLYEAGRDVWVLDMRCSAGLKTAERNWTFDVMAEQDIPAAIEHVLVVTRPCKTEVTPKIDIVAHCMGAAMFSMAVLGDSPQQKLLHQNIGRVVFSQVGPAMVLSPTNVLAAYIMRYARHFLGLEHYDFSPEGEVPPAGQFFDRVLAAMSMPRKEYKRENPFWPPGKATPWAGTRHRMDALYGRTFSLNNLSNDVLEHLDEFFGPFNIETLAQVIHFAASNTVTDIGGINRNVTPRRIRERLTFPMMSIHGEENGLVDVATLALMRNLLAKAGIPHLNSPSGVVPRGTEDDPVAKAQPARTIEKLIDRNNQDLARGQSSYLTWRIKGYGHQDCLIGKDARSICRVIAKYLGVPDETARISQDSLIGGYVGRPYKPPTVPLAPAPSYKAVAPEFGVRVIREDGKVLIQACDGPGHGPPLEALLIPVKRDGDKLRMDLSDMPTNCASLADASLHILKKQGIASPHLFEVPIDDSWLRHAKEVLVLLLYDQAEGIGGNARAPETTRNHAHQAQCPIVRAVSEALSSDTLDELRGGLISGALGDRHPERVEELRGAAISGALGHAHPERVTFALAACQYPSDILNHMPDGEHATRGPADMSLLALGDRLAEPEPPTLLLLAGDQIYADATGGLFDPKILYERYRIPYERRGQSRGSKAVMQRLDLDVQMMPDDHEIRDNWAPNDPGEEPGRRGSEIENGSAAYFLYQRAPEKVPPHVWHKKDHNGFRFFLGDARTERDGRTARNWRTARIMKPEQFEALCDWLVEPEHASRPKFVLTASALLPRRLAVTEHPACALQSDAWDGYPFSLHALLKFVCDREIKHLVFLSGDEHVSNLVVAHVRCKETGKSCTLHSIHSSALYAPYPFANGVPDDFKADDTFAFSFREPVEKWRQYCCRAKARFFPGDGFAVLTAQRGRSGWELDVKFHNESGKIKVNEDIWAEGSSVPC